MPGITRQPPRPPQGWRDGCGVLVWVPASNTGMGRCLSWDAFISDCCFHLGTHRVVHGTTVIRVSHPSPVPCRRGPGGILHCHSWVKRSCSSQGTRKAPPARCSVRFWRWLLLLCGIAWPAGNLGGQPESLTWLAKSLLAGHRQSHAAFPGRGQGKERAAASLSLLSCLSQAGGSLE